MASELKKLWRWNKDRIRVLDLLAEGEDPKEIERLTGTRQVTIRKWMENDIFKTALEAVQKELIARTASRGIGNRVNRVRALNELWEKTKRVITERAEDPIMQTVAGGRTGLLAHDIKSIGNGPAAREVDVFEFDAAIPKELRALQEAAAKELGQTIPAATVQVGIQVNMQERYKQHLRDNPKDVQEIAKALAEAGVLSLAPPATGALTVLPDGVEIFDPCL